MNKLKDFQLPEDHSVQEKVMAKNASAPDILTGKRHEWQVKLNEFVQKRFGKNAVITRWLQNSQSGSSGDEVVDALNQLKKTRSAGERLNAGLTVTLLLVLTMVWQWGFPMLREADQLKNDLKEQAQVIEIEKTNNLFLEKLASDQEGLDENIRTVYAAIPDADEKAEEVIAMLENIGSVSRMLIDAIGIRKVPESQINYSDLVGVVDLYEYTFTLESSLPNILNFIASLRKSLRLMDIIAMEIEENKGLYRASFVLYSYHLTK